MAQLKRAIPTDWPLKVKIGVLVDEILGQIIVRVGERVADWYSTRTPPEIDWVHVANFEGTRICGAHEGLKTVFTGPGSAANCPDCLKRVDAR